MREICSMHLQSGSFQDGAEAAARCDRDICPSDNKTKINDLRSFVNISALGPDRLG